MREENKPTPSEAPQQGGGSELGQVDYFCMTQIAVNSLQAILDDLRDNRATKVSIGTLAQNALNAICVAPTPPAPEAASLREALAELCHTQWSGWMKYLFEKCEDIPHPDSDVGEVFVSIPTGLVYRWGRQLQTPYAQLSEEEKESDRKEADRFLAALQSHPVSPAPIAGRRSCQAVPPLNRWQRPKGRRSDKTPNPPR